MTLDQTAKRALEHCTGRYGAMLQLVEALVATPSHSDDLAGVALCYDVLDAGLRSLGFEAARPEAPEGRPHLLATRPGRDPKAPTVLCLGHVDTIFNADYPGGTFGVHGSRALGSGVADMKAGLVVMVTALEALVATECIDQFRVRVLVTSDKEQGATGSRELIRRVASEADVALVFGPATEQGGVVRSCSGTGRFRVGMKGVSVTAQSRSPEGRNAIVELAHLIPELEGLNDSQRGVLVNCGMVSGGVRTGIVPAEATLDLEVWCDGPTDQRWFQSQLHNLARRASRGAMKATVTGGFSRPPWPPSARTDSLVEAWSHAATLLGYETLPGHHSTVGSDANLTHGVSVPTLDGLGARGGDVHSAEEWVAIEELPARAAISAIGLLAWLEDRGGTATWRVGGIIQGETPEEGQVEISTQEEAGEAVVIEHDRDEDALQLSEVDDTDDVFTEPGASSQAPNDTDAEADEPKPE